MPWPLRREDLPGTGQDEENPSPEVVLSSPLRAPSATRASAARRTIDVLSSGVDVFEEFFEHVQIGLAVADLTTRYIRVNATYAELLGRPPEDLIGVPFDEVLHPDDRTEADARVTRLLSGRDRALTAEERYVTPDGRERWVLHGVALVRDAEGGAGWLAVSAQDVTERRRVEQDLHELTASLTERAVRDPLTGLANRILLEERLRGSLARDGRSGGSTAVLFLDLDGFKAVNDRHGHAAGDAVLKIVADRLAAVVRPSDTVARLGGDEFVVLLEGVAEEILDPLVARLQLAVGASVALDQVRPGLSVDVRVSVGVAMSRSGEADAASLLAAADSRMYAAKRAPRP